MEQVYKIEENGEEKYFKKVNREPVVGDTIIIQECDNDCSRSYEDFPCKILSRLSEKEWAVRAIDPVITRPLVLYSNEFFVVEEIKDDGKLRLVERNAKPGEYIVLREELFSFNRRGDILKVSQTTETNYAQVKAKDHPRAYDYDVLNALEAKDKKAGRSGGGPLSAEGPDYLWNYSSHLYYVIENYKPHKED